MKRKGGAQGRCWLNKSQVLQCVSVCAHLGEFQNPETLEVKLPPEINVWGAWLERLHPIELHFVSLKFQFQITCYEVNPIDFNGTYFRVNLFQIEANRIHLPNHRCCGFVCLLLKASLLWLYFKDPSTLTSYGSPECQVKVFHMQVAFTVCC